MKLDDIREQPTYTLGEAARYLKVAPATLRSWTIGREYQTKKGTSRSKALIHLPTRTPPLLLSFNNLVEAHVLRSLRTDHGIPLGEVRHALDFAQRKLGVDRLLLREELVTEGGRIFLARYGELLELSASTQLAMRKLFEAHLKRVEWDTNKFSSRLYPFLTLEDAGANRPIGIDPSLAFGRPVVIRSGVSTRAIAERIDAGETVEELARDYRMKAPEIEDAVLYERAA